METVKRRMKKPPLTKIEYEVSVKDYLGLWFEESFIIEFESNAVKRAEILHLPVVPQESARFNIIFYLKPFYNRNSLWEQIEEHVSEIVDYLAFEYALRIEKVQRLGEFRNAFIFSTTCDFTKDQIRKMEKELTQKSYDPYKRLYRIALQHEEPVGRFLLLYNLLCEKLGNGQEVDQFIRIYCKNVYKAEEEICTRKNKKSETIYTWLKNQIGHTKTNKEMGELKAMIQEKLSELSFIVQKAIRHRIN